MDNFLFQEALIGVRFRKRAKPLVLAHPLRPLHFGGVFEIKAPLERITLSDHRPRQRQRLIELAQRSESADGIEFEATARCVTGWLISLAPAFDLVQGTFSLSCQQGVVDKKLFEAINLFESSIKRPRVDDFQLPVEQPIAAESKRTINTNWGGSADLHRCEIGGE